ncbi:peptidase C69 [Pelomyxa schiedti]|nr:peptidase C69 [Pelomyxa schiedti]
MIPTPCLVTIFSDTYNPVTVMSARTCESRVYAFFRHVVGSSIDQYYNYIYGDITWDDNGYATNRMPLWVLPSRKLKQADIFDAMRDHFEGTGIDLHDTPGSGDGLRPYRWRPMTFTSGGQTYFNERAVGTQQTGFSFIAQQRSWLPDPIGGIFWFGVDDTATSVYMPMYCSITEVPENFKQGNGDMLTYSETSGFWLWNRVSNFAYLRYNYMITDIQTAQGELEEEFLGQIASVDATAQGLYKTNPDAAVAYLTSYSVSAGARAFQRWVDLDRYLLMKYMDGNIKVEENGEFATNGYGQAAFPNQPGFPQWFYDDIVEHTGDLHLYIETAPSSATHSSQPPSKPHGRALKL